jgi:hypothetical protein
MPTIKKRINISLSPRTEKLLEQVAKRDNVPEATKAVSLLELALEIEEDIVFDRIAHERVRASTTWLTHDEVWK